MRPQTGELNKSPRKTLHTQNWNHIVNAPKRWSFFSRACWVCAVTLNKIYREKKYTHFIKAIESILVIFPWVFFLLFRWTYSMLFTWKQMFFFICMQDKKNVRMKEIGMAFSYLTTGFKQRSVAYLHHRPNSAFVLFFIQLKTTLTQDNTLWILSS